MKIVLRFNGVNEPGVSDKKVQRWLKKDGYGRYFYLLPTTIPIPQGSFINISILEMDQFLVFGGNSVPEYYPSSDTLEYGVDLLSSNLTEKKIADILEKTWTASPPE